MANLFLKYISEKSNFVNIHSKNSLSDKYQVVKGVLNDDTLYFASCGRQSSNINAFEISELFARINNLSEGSNIKITILQKYPSTSKIALICSSEDYQVCFDKFRYAQKGKSYPIFYNENDYISLRLEANYDHEYVYIEDNAEVEIKSEIENCDTENKMVANFEFYLLEEKEYLINDYQKMRLNKSFIDKGFHENKWYDIEFECLENFSKRKIAFQLEFIDIDEYLSNSNEEIKEFMRMKNSLMIYPKNLKILLSNYKSAKLSENAIKSDFSDILDDEYRIIKKSNCFEIKIFSFLSILETQELAKIHFKELIEKILITKNENHFNISNLFSISNTSFKFVFESKYTHLIIRFNDKNKFIEYMERRMDFKNIIFKYKGKRKFNLINLFYKKELLDIAEKSLKEENLIIEGQGKIGKSTLIQTFVKNNYRLKITIIIDFQKIKDSKMKLKNSLLKFEQKFLEIKILNEKFENFPKSIIIFDNADALLRKYNSKENLNPADSGIIMKFIQRTKSLIKQFLKISNFVLICPSHEKIDNEISVYFPSKLKLDEISKEKRRNYCNLLKRDFEVKNSEEIFKYIEKSTFYDLSSLENRLSLIIGEIKEKRFEALIEILKDLFPTKDENSLYPLFSHIAGNANIKFSVQEIIHYPIKYSFLFRELPISLSKGILLYGPSGCGKTFFAKSIANEFNLNFISVKGPELLNKYIGESERGVRDIFHRAASNSPSILFFDEFESLVPTRSSGGTAVTDRIVNQFLTFLDGVEGFDNFKFTIVVASSKPELIDPAVLRPGRIDNHLYLGFPDDETRLELIKMNSEGLELSDIPKETHIQDTKYFSSSDTISLLKEFHLSKLNLICKGEIGEEQLKANNKVDLETWEKIRKNFRPGQSQTKFLELEHYYSSFKNKKGANIKEQKQIQQ